MITGYPQTIITQADKRFFIKRRGKKGLPLEKGLCLNENKKNGLDCRPPFFLDCFYYKLCSLIFCMV